MAAPSTAPSKLLSSPVLLSALREDAWRDLTEALRDFQRHLDSADGDVTLVVDPALEPLIQAVVPDGAKSLAEWRVEAIVPLLDAPQPATSRGIVYITRPHHTHLRAIINQVRSFTRRGARKVCHCLLVPRRTLLAESVLREAGILAASGAGTLVAASDAGGGGRSGGGGGGIVHECTVSVGELTSLDVLPIDDDVVTLSLDSLLADVAVNSDVGPLLAVARALVKLQDVFGPFPTMRAKGPLAHIVTDAVVRLQQERNGTTTAGAAPAAATAAPSPATVPLHLPSLSADTRAFAASVPVAPMTDAASSKRRGAGAAAAAGEGAEGGGSSAAAYPSSDFDGCIVLDRLVDPFSLLLTPLTYEALVNEIFGVTCGVVALERSFFGEDDDAPAAGAGSRPAAAPSPAAGAGDALVPLHLNSNSKLYAELRDVHIQVAGPRLQQRAKEMQALRDSITKANTASLAVSDIKRFVKQIPGFQDELRMLKVLISLTAALQEQTNDASFVERWQLERTILDEDNPKLVTESLSARIARRQPLPSLLRLVALACVVEGGFKAKQLEAYRRAIVHSYGMETALPALMAMERLGWLREREGGSEGGLGIFSAVTTAASYFAPLRRSLCLVADVPDVDDAADLHYVTSGYAPLSVRLVQMALGLPIGGPSSTGGAAGSGAAGGAGLTVSSWDAPAAAELLRTLPGPAWSVVQMPADGAAAAAAAAASASRERKVMAVVMIGGFTAIEVSALRWLNERYPVDFVLVGTAFPTGTQAVATIVKPLRNVLREGLASSRTAGGSGATAMEGKDGAAGGAGKGTAGSAAAPKPAAGGAGGTGGGGLFGFGRR